MKIDKFKKYDSEDVKYFQKSQRDVDTPTINGYPTFNTCDHLLLDFSDIERGTDNWQNTISVKLPNGKYVTMCIMDLGDSINIDTKFHGVKETRVLGFREGKTATIDNMNLYAFIGKVD